MSSEESQLRQQIVNHCKWLSSQNYNQVTSGNISVRVPAEQGSTTSQPRDSILITPSGQSYAQLEPDMIVLMNMDGTWKGNCAPSSEWRFHIDILRARPEIQSVVHTHSMFATIQSMTRQAIPAGHYLISLLGGSDIRCAPYARFGSQALSTAAVSALEGRLACLLSNHGAIALGKNLKQAVDNAVLLETLAKQYYFAKIAGICLLTENEVAETIAALDQLPAYSNR